MFKRILWLSAFLAASAFAGQVIIKSRIFTREDIAVVGETTWDRLANAASQTTQELWNSTRSLMKSGSFLLPDALIQSLSSELPTHDVTVGNTPGEAGVSGGSASYSIPIALPPGRKGMQPNISLNYSSRGGNGIAGMGWNVSGFSSLHRCPMTVEQDGQTRAVDYSMNDRLCFDGQRLVATSGTYGAVNTTYATEIDSFSRITQLGGDLNAVNSYFKVEYKSGEIAYFGGTSTAVDNSRVIAGGLTKPLNWLIARTEDRLGNNIVYTYTNFGNGEIQPAAIFYTGFTTTNGDRKVEFVYEARPTAAGANDQSSSYLAGGLTQQTQRLTTIKTWVASEAVREYRLNYGAVSAVSGRSLLRSVQECAMLSGAATCRVPTSFNWQDTPAGHSLKQVSLAIPGLPDPSLAIYVEEISDLDGDGVKELYVTYSGTPTRYFISYDANRNLRGAIPATSIPGAESFNIRKLQDFNHDGRDDFLGAATINGVPQFTVGVWNNSTTQWLESGFTIYPLGIPYSNCSAEPADYNGDGFTDLLVTYLAAGEAKCDRGNMHLKVFLGIAPTVAGQPAINTTAAVDIVLPQGSSILVPSCCATNIWDTIPNPAYTLDRVDDFNGDGLADVFLTRRTGRSERDKPQLLWLGRANGGTYTLGGAGNEITSFAALASPQLTPGETHVSSFNQWIDVNGDGLTDLVGTKRQPDGFGYWTVRLNKGGILGEQIVTTNRRGIEVCVSTTTTYLAASCLDRWLPMFSSLISTADTNTDGRVEMLVPRSFAARICFVDNYKTNFGEYRETWYCSENPITGAKDPPPEIQPPESAIHGVYGAGGQFDSRFQGQNDSSAYYMDAISFVQTSATAIRADTNSTQIVKSGRGNAVDHYSDGLQDQVSLMGFAWKPTLAADGTTNYGYAIVGPQGSASTLPDPGNTPVTQLVANPILYISENNGAGTRANLPSLVPDLISSITNGFGQQTQFDYFPMLNNAGRTSGTPLYSVPSDPAARYIDARHTYFNNSMQLVSEMKQSDGVGGMNTMRYGYSEAMYNTQGRGFQGFRKIIEENVSSGLRTTTTFHQKYPLTSRVEKVVVSPISRPGELDRISQTENGWRCNRANTADTTACDVTSGINPVRFVYLAGTEHVTFDLNTAIAGLPYKLNGFTADYFSDTTACDGGTISSVAGYDAYGNITSKTHFVSDYSEGTPGYKNYIALACNRTRNTYETPDTTNWWLDKLSNTETRNEILHGADQPLPSGASNPVYVTNNAYTWNANRTLATETFQNGIANQQKLTAYAYPGSSNYGLPLSVTVTASGDQNAGGRTTSTTYSTDGYFPLSVTNALGHTATTAVRLRDGLPISVTDPNGLRTLTTYDAFSQAVLVKSRGGLDSQYLSPDKQIAATRCTITGGVNSCGLINAAYKLTSVQDGNPTSVTTHDALGRVLRTQSKLLDGSNSYSDTQYNNKGQITAQSLPYRTGDTPAWTYFVNYDILGRLTAKSAPQQHATRGDMVTTYAYTGRTTAIQVCGSLDPNTSNCLNLSRTTDSTGRYVETADALGGVTKFWYDANGQAAVLQDVKGNQIKATYNAIGQRTQVNDPNQGISNFTYNALGEVLTQADARSITSTTTYDKLGRKTQFNVTADENGDGVNDAIVDTWIYDPSGAKGRLTQSKRTINGVVERQENNTFDALIRPSSVAAIQNTGGGTTRNYSSEFQYDTYYGRLLAQFFPNGEGEQFIFNQYGYETEQRNAVNSSVYRQIAAVDAAGRPTHELKGFNLITDTAYWPNGQTKSITHQKDGVTIRKINYAYDVFGNIATQELNQGMAGNTLETFSYDNLHRLTQSTRTGATNTTVTYGYDAAGNFNFKSDFSLATGTPYSLSTGGLGGGGANAVKSVQLKAGGTRSYAYDASGNMTADNAGFAAIYDHANLATKLQRGAVINYFTYDANNAKARQTGTDGSKVYLGGYEDWITAGQTKVSLGNYAQVTNGTGGRILNYFLTDRLGSVDAVTDGNGNLIETRGYDAFGAPRTGIWADATQLASTAITPKGFTSHEHLNSVQLIHMNGRMYDYQLGRFLSVDPFIQMPTNSQSLNPYSYLMNNPLSGTDPTGYLGSCDSISFGGTGSGHCTYEDGGQTKTAAYRLGNKTLTYQRDVTDATGHRDTVTQNINRNGNNYKDCEGCAKPEKNGAPLNQNETGNRGGLNESQMEIAEHDRVFGGPLRRGRNAAIQISDGIGNAISPCSADASTARCGGEILATYVAGKATVWAFGKVLRIGKGFGDGGALKNAEEALAPNSAEEAARLARLSGRDKGAAAEYRIGDKIYTDVSRDRSNDVLDIRLSTYLENAPAPRAPWHGNCAEVGCIDQALKDGVDTNGGVSRAVNIVDGTVKKTCDSCKAMVERFGGTYDQ